MAKEYKDKKGATGKKYTTVGDVIKVTYTDGSTRVVRPTDKTYAATKRDMEKDITSKKWYKPAGNSKTTAETAVGKGVTDGIITTAEKVKQNEQYSKTMQQRRGLVKNDNIIDAVAHGGETGWNTAVSGIKSGAVGVAQTAADVVGADKTADALGRTLRQMALESAARQQAINAKYNTNFSGIAKGVSDVTAGAVGMIPTIASFALTPQGKLAAAGKAAQLGAKALGFAPLALQAGGGGMNQALNEGADLDAAKQYGALTAAKEIATELPFAGIKYVPGVKNVGELVAEKVANQTAKKVAAAAANMAGEGAEEALSEIVDPLLQRATYNEDAENASVKDVAYTALLGGLTAGALNTGIKGAETVPNVVKNLPNAQKVMQNDQNRAFEALHGQKMGQNQVDVAQNAQNRPKQVQVKQTTKHIQAPVKTAETEEYKAKFTPESQQNIQNEKTGNIPPKTTLEMSERTFENVGDKNVRAYQQENPAVKPFYQRVADDLLSDLQQGIKGGRDAGIDPETRNVTTMGGWQRQQSEPIERMLRDGMSYNQIEDGLQRIVEDHGKENTANAKRAELYVDDAVRKGYRSVVTGDVSANRAFAYRGKSREELQQIMEQLDNSFTGNAEQDAAIISEMETVQNLLDGRQQEPTVAKNTTVAQESSEPVRMDYEDAASIPADAIDFLNNAKSKSGLDIRVVTGLSDNVNGMYRDGKVYLNANKLTDADTIRTVTAHEVYHAMKNTSEFRDLQDVALDFYRTINPNLTNTDLVQMKIEEYGSEGVQLTEDEAYEELTADFIEVALSEPKVAERIWTEKPTLAQRILRFIDDLLFNFRNRKLSDLEYEQKAILEQAQRMYSDGLQSMQYQGKTSETGETRYMFAGVNSRTADREALARAQQMEADGADMETIRQQTGWFKSKVTGNKWAYEISDKGVQFDRNAPRFPVDFEAQEIKKQMVTAIKENDLEKYGRLQKQLKALPTDTTPRRDILMDWMSHPELYEAYPELRNTPFKLDEDMRMNGSFDGRTIRVKSSLDKMYTENGIPRKLEIGDTTDTMLHEIQHAIQKKEGFPKGSSVEGWEDQRRREAKKVSLRRQAELASELEKLPKSLLTKENIDRGISILDKADVAYSAVKESDYWRGSDEKRMEEADKRFDRLYDEAVAGGYDKLFLNYVEERLWYDNINKSDIFKSHVQNYGLYENTAGEIMARDTMRRHNLDAEQRRQKQPAMGDGNTVYADYGDSHSVGRTTDGKPVVKIETDIFANMKPGEKKHKVVADYIKEHIGEVYTIIESGQKVYVGKDLPGEYTQSKSTRQLPNGRLNAKNQASQGIGEMIEIATDRRWEKSKKAKHKADAKYGFYKYKTRFALPDGEVYTADLLIRNDENGKKYLYDMITIKKDSSTLASTRNGSARRADFSALDGSNYLLNGNSISQNQQKVNRYSLGGTNSRYQEMVDRYGSIEPGENPNGTNRDVKVPKQTSDFDKTRQFARTAMEAEQVDYITTGMIADDLVDDMQSGRFVYEPTSNREQVYRANSLISQTGWEQQAEQFRNKYRSGESMTADDIALGERLIQEAQKAGDYQTAVDLIADVAAIGTEAGRSVQALKILKRLTPEGQLMALKRIEQRINGSLVAQGKQPVALPEGLAEEMLQARGPEKQAEIWDRGIQELANQVPATLADKINAWRYLAMLSNPRTHIRNMLGNATMRTVMGVKNIAQTFGEALFLPQNSERTAAIRVPKEYRKFAEWDYEEHAKRMLEAGGGRYNDEIGLVSQNKKIFNNRALEAARKFNSGALEWEDMIFKKTAYVDAMSRYMYANGLSPSVLQSQASRTGATYEQGQNFAVEQAKKATFQEASKLAQKLSEIENMNNVSKIVMGAIVPFKKTPVNILKRGFEYSPVGIMNGLKKAVMDIKKGEATPAEAIDTLSAGLTGTGIMMLGYFMASQGLLSGGADDDDQRKARYDSQMGSQNYALVLPDGSTYTIDWLAPSVMPLMVGAELQKQLSGNVADSDNATGITRALEALTKVGNPVLEMSMLQGLTDALQSYNSGTGQFLSDFITSAATSYGGQFIPAPVGALARTMDDIVRSSYSPKDSQLTKEGETFLRQQRSKIPSLPVLNELGITSESNEASIDVWGNERKREFAGDAASDVAMRVINNFINPSTYSSNKRTELDNKLNELYEATGNSNVLPKSAASYIDASEKNPKVYLNSEEYTRFAKTKGQKSQRYVDDFVNSAVYSSLDDEAKADIIADLYSLANYEAKKEALTGRGIDYSTTMYEKALQSGVEPYEYYATKARFGGKWSDYDDAAKFSGYADRMQMLDDKFVEVYDALGDLKADKDKNGKSVSGSRQEKVENYLNSELSAGRITKEQWWYFYTKEYSSKTKNSPYSWIREANK